MNSPVGRKLADLAGIANSCLLGPVPPASLGGGAFPIASGAALALPHPLARLNRAFTLPLPWVRCAGSAGVRPWLPPVGRAHFLGLRILHYSSAPDATGFSRTAGGPVQAPSGPRPSLRAGPMP